jgi:hypothetical protein
MAGKTSLTKVNKNSHLKRLVIKVKAVKTIILIKTKQSKSRKRIKVFGFLKQKIKRIIL